MTREEALDEVKNYENYPNGLSKECRDYILKALEQEPVIDKIRAEIEQLPTKARINWDGCCPDFDYPEIEYVDVGKKKLLSIIDKYKAEIEPQESEE